MNKYPESAGTSTKVMFVNFGQAEELYCLPLLGQLRKSGISAEIFPEAAKMKKQMSYADAKKIPFVAMVGENEMNENVIALKDMQTGEQVKVAAGDIVKVIASRLS